MPRISNTREIIERADPVEIIGRRMPLQRSGNDHNGRCPFHSGGRERTPSLHVTPEKGWYCHACKNGGTSLDFLMEYEKLEFIEAVELLASETGMRVQFEETPNDGQDQDSGPRRHELYAAVQAAAEHYVQQLADNNGEPRSYAEERGLNEHVRNRWQIGYARGNSVKHAADPDILHQAGVLKKSDKSGEYYDPLAGRLIIPLHDTTGRPIGFTGRALPTNNSSAKYLNTGDTRIYKKSHHLFAYHAAVRLVRAHGDKNPDAPVVVEGQLNAIMCHEQCIPAVAPGGSTLTERQALLLQRLSETTRLAYDPDAAGVAATTKAANVLRNLGQTVKVAILGRPDTYTDRLPDPADLAANHEIIGFTDKDLITWAVDTLLTEKRHTAAWAHQITRQILPLVASHKHSAVRDVEIKQLAEKTGLSVVALNQDAENLEKELADGSSKQEPAQSTAPKIDTRMNKARSLCAIALQMELQPNDPNHWQLYLRALDLPVALLQTLSSVGRVRTVAANHGIPVTTAITRLAKHNTLAHPAHLRHWSTVELPGPPDTTGFCRVQDRLIQEEYQRRFQEKELI